MIARVSLEIALRKEFDYAIPPELAAQVDVGTRVQVPFGPRKVLGVVTALAEESAHTNLKPIVKVIGAKALITPRVLKLARWIADYYCCAPEIALKSVLPEVVRREETGWRERLFVRALPVSGALTKLPKRQREIWNMIEERRELPLAELLDLADTTGSTVRRLEDKGLIEIAPQISERDPYAREHILPTRPIVLNPAQAKALDVVTKAMDVPRECASGVPPEDQTSLVEGAVGQSPENMVLRAGSPAARSDQRAFGVPPEDPASTAGALPKSPFFNPETDVHKYSRWLPHWRQAERMYFVTFRLADSVAQDQLHAWAAQKQIWESHHPKPWDEKTWHEYHERFTLAMERLLDSGHGSCSLRQPAIAKIVEEALRFCDGTRYQLGEFVVMPNHVHVLVRPAENKPLEKILHSWKSFTAKQANAPLQKTGAFWREEYFDHLVRSSTQYERFCGYIRANPEKARLGTGKYRLGKGTFDLQTALQRASGIVPEGHSELLGTSVICGQDAPQHVQPIALGGCSAGDAPPSHRYAADAPPFLVLTG